MAVVKYKVVIFNISPCLRWCELSCNNGSGFNKCVRFKRVFCTKQ